MRQWIAAVCAGLSCLGACGCNSVLPYEPAKPVGIRPVKNPGGGLPPIATLPNGPVPQPSPSTPPSPAPNPKPVPAPIDLPPNTPPGGNPDTKPAPQTPPGDPQAQWAPWPLPPKSQSLAAVDHGEFVAPKTHAATNNALRRPLNVATLNGSRACKHFRSRMGLPGDARTAQLVDGVPARPDQDLRYRGGRTLPHFSYVNLYVDGDKSWPQETVQNIDLHLEAAMTDAHLNNVIRQYFQNAEISSQALASHPLVGYKPATVTRGDIQEYLRFLDQQGYLAKFDVTTTCFNFMLPSGTTLSDDDFTSAAAKPQAAVEKEKAEEEEEEEANNPVPHDEEVDSNNGLGGYHGSIHIGSRTLYYSAIVYSERLPSGKANGIPVFPDAWKNVVATLYHELQEFRTDPDVEDAVRNPTNPNSVRYLGWTSDAGEEIGDFPLHDGPSIALIVKEVPLADGSGTVPVQLQYSNAVHGPEGPIPQPHPLGMP